MPKFAAAISILFSNTNFATGKPDTSASQKPPATVNPALLGPPLLRDCRPPLSSLAFARGAHPAAETLPCVTTLSSNTSSRPKLRFAQIKSRDRTHSKPMLPYPGLRPLKKRPSKGNKLLSFG